MIVLIDFENTHASGLEGYEYLNQNDTLVMYYSDENSSLTKGMVDDLKKNHVHVSLVKLLKQHSNALDMYIASTTGMYLDSGEKICIVSKDKGYAAVRDFWHSLRGAEILLGETIRECLLHSVVNDDKRILLCKERSQKTSLVDAFTTMNTVPTKPTLSRQHNGRHRKNNPVVFTGITEPAPILPNPLSMDTDKPTASREPAEKPVNDAESSGTKHSNHGGYDGLDRINDLSKKRNEQKQNEKKKAMKKEDVKKAPATAPVPETSTSTSLAKLPPKEDPNRVQFVWDPVSRSMKKMGGEETAKAETSEPVPSKEAETLATTVVDSEKSALIPAPEDVPAETAPKEVLLPDEKEAPPADTTSVPSDAPVSETPSATAAPIKKKRTAAKRKSSTTTSTKSKRKSTKKAEESNPEDHIEPKSTTKKKTSAKRRKTKSDTKPEPVQNDAVSASSEKNSKEN